MRSLSFLYESGDYRQEMVYARNADMQGTFRKPTSIGYVTGTRYLENTPEVYRGVVGNW